MHITYARAGVCVFLTMLCTTVLNMFINVLLLLLFVSY